MPPDTSSIRPGVRRKAQSAVPGDGAAVGLVTLSAISRLFSTSSAAPTANMPARWCWPRTRPASGGRPVPASSPSASPKAKITKVLARGNRQVPEVALAVCDRIGLSSKDIDLLVTNQPNRVFLRNWREALELPKERHRDTFDECGNLFGAGIPINLDHAISDGQVKAGDVVMMAAFAHAGDFAGAAAVRWGGRRLMHTAREPCRRRDRWRVSRRDRPVCVVAQRESVSAAAGGAVGVDPLDRCGQPVSGVSARAAAEPDRRSYRPVGATRWCWAPARPAWCCRPCRH